MPGVGPGTGPGAEAEAAPATLMEVVSRDRCGPFPLFAGYLLALISAGYLLWQSDDLR